ncbi:MAG TPA: amidohydrolase family protein [Agriterribacter sp.]|nr:amidohydrolase family protein [Agriterribacter sp.]
MIQPYCFSCTVKKRIHFFLYCVSILTGVFACNRIPQNEKANANVRHSIVPVNAKEISSGTKTIAIINATIIDGLGGEALTNGFVLIQGNTIEQVGKMGTIRIPADAEITDAKGMSVLPGLIDAHFHLDRTKDLPALFLQHGVTSVRDPGAWIEAYGEERKSGKMMPRLFLTGPHLDMAPPAYPYDAYIVRDVDEANKEVNDLADQGATAIKIYFRVPPGMIKAICSTAHQRGLPVTAHLEITEAMAAIEAGLDGVEHITSFGLSLVPKREGEVYRQGMMADNNYRKQGRYNMWKDIDVNSAEADSLIRFLVRKGTFITPTLGPFEYQLSTETADSAKWVGFSHMMAMTAKMNKSGVHLVLGSHSLIPYAETGWAYQREMELWVESGIPNAAVIVAATMENARYFRIADRLGSIEKGKTADLLLVKGNPLTDIKAMRDIEKVMLNGVWVPAGEKLPKAENIQ